ncbi:acyl-CoA-binding protein homolog [Anthonomus grandis grandis]|uniref:acyl-CoA-binding protein homolog n=1 Tax=Anthonomus grandis grandis TaxID=2921223 RepID=UPI0021662B56|nr:acyl-CoA-binding protein homolog [Anthonomus grandis grandis]
MGLEENFTASANQARGFTKRPPDADCLEVYALYKQATVGDTNTAKPSGGELLSKWNAWNSKKGMTQKQAKEQYIAKVAALAPKYA